MTMKIITVGKVMLYRFYSKQKKQLVKNGRGSLRCIIRPPPATATFRVPVSEADVVISIKSFPNWISWWARWLEATTSEGLDKLWIWS